MTEITIILPVYNVEKYLKQCLDSIANQTFKDFECICVNDGSTDNSLEILKSYADKDNRFKIISQQNKGLAGARNTGIKATESEYLTFIDSDDWIKENYLELLYKKITETDADIVRASHIFYHESVDIYEPARARKKRYRITTNSDIERLYKGYESAYVWGKLYRTHLIKVNNIYFYEGNVSEDCPFSALAFLYAKKIEFIPDNLLFYRKRNTSITGGGSGSSKKLRSDALFNFITLTKDLEKRSFFKDKEIKKYCINIFVYKIGGLKINNLDKEDIDILTDAILEHFKYLKYKMNNLSVFYRFELWLMLKCFEKIGISFVRVLRILKNFLKN